MSTNPLQKPQWISTSLPTTSLPTQQHHVIFVIHGMGQRYPKFVSNISYLRDHTQDLLQEKFNQQDKPERMVHFVPVEWHEQMHALDTADVRMRKITLPTVPMLRIINNEYLGDVVYYFTRYHGQAIVNLIVNSINQTYERFKQAYPHWDGSASILGHSLGGVIAYDLLCHQQFDCDTEDGCGASSSFKTDSTFSKTDTAQYSTLSKDTPLSKDGRQVTYPLLAFKPQHLFVAGSPVAAVMVMRGMEVKDYQLPSGIRFHNVFHPYDPLAYRFEPLVDQRYSDVDPVLIEHWNEYRFPTLLRLPSISLPSFSSPSLSLPAFPSASSMLADYTLPDVFKGISNSWDTWMPFTVKAASPQSHSESDTDRVSQSPPRKRQRVTRKPVKLSSAPHRRQGRSSQPKPRRDCSPSPPKTSPRLEDDPLEVCDGVTLEQPSSRPSRFSESQWPRAMEGDTQVVQEVALNSLYSTAATFSTELATGTHTDGSIGEANADDTWKLATVRAGEVFRTMAFTLANTFSRIVGNKEETPTGASPNKKRKRTEEDDVKPGTQDFPDSACRERLDFVLPVNLNLTHEYFSALSAHFAYWHHKDMAYHILQSIFPH